MSVHKTQKTLKIQPQIILHYLKIFYVCNLFDKNPIFVSKDKCGIHNAR